MSEYIFNLELLRSAIGLSTPIILGALGAAICLKSGISNLGIEGYMLMGAFSAVIVSYHTNNPYLGVLAAVIVGICVCLIFGVLHIHLKANSIIAGLAVNLFADSFTSWLLVDVLDTGGSFSPADGVPGLPRFDFPMLKNIPIIASIFNNRNLLDYLNWLLIILLFFFMTRYFIGLRIRSVGEHPNAALTAGINPQKYKFLALVLCGMLCGLGGAYVSLASLRLFSKNMIAGKGFISFTTAVFASGNILPTSFVGFIFSAFLGLSIKMEGFGVPFHFVEMIPYAITIIALVFNSINVSRTHKRKTLLAQRDISN